MAFTVIPTPSISSVSPTSGPVGISVTITGTNFGATQGSSTVTFNGTAATVSSWSATSIIAAVPSTATTGNIVVTVGGLASNGVTFTVLPTPSISSVSPTSGLAGASVTITGTNFGSAQGSSTVKFNGTAATVSSWSNTSIVAAVPSGATTGSVVVTVSGVASNGVAFTVLIPPAISSLSPASGSWGTSVTITGTNFGATQGSSTVKFSGVAATVSSWSNTSIVAAVPSAITTGSVVVTVNGLASNGVTFTVSGAYSLSVGPGTLVYLEQTTTSSCPIGSGAPPPMGTLTVTSFGSFSYTAAGVTQSLSGGIAYISSPGGSYGCPASGWEGVIPVQLTGPGYTIVFTPSLSGAGSATYVLTPSIASISPTSGVVGTSVTITGTNFGSTQGSNTVTFNGTAAAVSSWSATSIVAVVPSGATTGNVVVTIGGVASNGVAFTVIPTISVASSGTPSIYGNPVTFTATVTSTDTNTITFYSGSASLGTATPSNGVAKITASSLQAGTFSITASIAAGVNYGMATSSPISQVVNPKTPTISISNIPSSSVSGGSYTPLYSYSGVGSPIETVTSSTTNVCAVAGAVVNFVGTGTCTLTAKATAVTNYTAATGTPQSFTVSLNATTTLVTLSPITSWLGYPVLVNVTVTGPGGLVPTSGGGIVCTATPPASAGNPITISWTLSANTEFAQKPLVGLPLTPTGTSYSVTCAFTSNNAVQFSNSNSLTTPVYGTVTSQPAPVETTASGQLITLRAGHQATLLDDGTVLVTGGVSGKVGTDGNTGVNPSGINVLASTELYSNGTFVSGAQLSTPRFRHTATLLPNGQVLITGGFNGGSYLATAELYTPGSTPGSLGSFAATAEYDSSNGSFDGPQTQMHSPRYFHTATFLPASGQVLIVGGTSDGSTALNTAELYDPLTGQFTLTSPMSTARWMHTATLLSDGTVLIAGGDDGAGDTLSSAEIYNPGTNKFTLVSSSMLIGRKLAQAIALGDGTVLITGGAGAGCGAGYPNIRTDPANQSVNTQDTCYLNDAEIYNAGTFVATAAPMNRTRYLHSATSLPDGTVLIAGGITSVPDNVDGTEEIYYPSTKRFTLVGNLAQPRWGHTATAIANTNLPGGTTNVANEVLFIGGEDGQRIGYTPVGPGTSAEVYGSTWISGGLHPKYMVLGIMYAPPGSGSSVNYSRGNSFQNTTSTTNSFSSAMSVTLGFGNIPIKGKSISSSGDSIQGSWTYATSGSATYTMTAANTDSINVPGPSSSTLGVDHESDIIWVWLNPESDYTAGSDSALVWNGYSANPNDTNVSPDQMDIVPLTVSQLDGTSPIPPDLQDILDRNWDPAAYGGAGGLTSTDLATILQRDPFATNASTTGYGQRSTLPTNVPGVPGIPIFDPNIPAHDPSSSDPNQCGQRYTFDPILGQTFSFSPLSSQNQADTSTFTLNTQTSLTKQQTTTDTYKVGISLCLGTSINSCSGSGGGEGGSGGENPSGGGGTALSIASLTVADTLTFVNQWNPQTVAQNTSTQTLTIKNPLPTDNYKGPSEMQVWRDNLYGTYMFYPKPDDTTVTLTTSQVMLQAGSPVTLTATITPDPNTQLYINHTEPVPSENVSFYDGCTLLGTQPTVAGTATLLYTWPTTASGTHTIRAVSSGDVNYFHNVSNSLTQSITSAATPNISSISPSTGPIGTKVTLTGVNFGVSGTVTFNSIPAQSITWTSATSVQAVVPAGATTGPIVLTANGYASNSVPFIVTEASTISTTTTIELSPSSSWSGYPAEATALVTAANDTLPAGQVSCVSSPSTGASNTAGTVNSATGIAQVSIMDAPIVPLGSSASIPYSVTCTFTPSNPVLFASSQSNPASGTVIPIPSATTGATGSLNMPRENHQTTLLNDGTVLVTGGDAGKYAGANEDGPYVVYLQSSEIYSNGVFTLAAQMTTPRSMHQATLLSKSTGQVLITGGANCEDDPSCATATPLDSAELFTPGAVPGTPGSFALTTLYDPAAGGFTTTPSKMTTPRFWHTATQLLNGKVLIAGGTSTNGDYNADDVSFMATTGANGTPGSSLASAEIYDPLTGAFTPTNGPMMTARSRHTAALLADGTVLIAGGIDANGYSIDTAEIYDPSTGTFHATNGPMVHGRIRAQATRLGDGTVLVSGGAYGAEQSGGTNGPCPLFRTSGQLGCSRIDAEIYNPVAGTFTATPTNMNTARYSHTATLLYDGTVLISGGFTNGSNNTVGSTSTEIYSPTNKTFTQITDLIGSRYNHTATLLPGLGVLFVGGASGDTLGALPLGYPGNGSSNAELYSVPLQTTGIHPKFMVLNVIYAPPGVGSTVSYTDQTQVGVTSSIAGTIQNELDLSVSGSVGSSSIGFTGSASGSWTYAQTDSGSYAVNTTTTTAMTVPGPCDLDVGATSPPTGCPTAATVPTSGTIKSPGVNHEADVIWVWLNPEADFALPTPSSVVWNGFATNRNDTNVAVGEMDIVPLTVGQLDGTTPIPNDLLTVLDRNWDPVSAGGAGALNQQDYVTILQRDPFAVNLSGTSTTPVAASVRTDIPPGTTYSNTTSGYALMDPNIPVSVPNPNSPGTYQCSQRFQFSSSNGQTLQFATLGNTNQAYSQSYSLQSNTQQQNQSSYNDQYDVGLSLSACFPLASCNSGASVTVKIGDTFTWGEKKGSQTSNQTMVTQALTIKNPLPSEHYTGPVQMQVWQDSLYGTFMFYPKATDTAIVLSSSQPITQVGDSVTLTATVIPDPAIVTSSGALPTGTITFFDGCTQIGNPVPLANGIATVVTSWSTASPSSHTIEASYSGDSNYFNNDAFVLSQTVAASTAAIPYINAGGIQPSSGSAGSTITISGQNFGAAGVVTFNGIPASTSAWSTNSITATVPAGATSGPLVVTSNNYASNSVYFAVKVAPAQTTTTVALTPVVSLSGKSVGANVEVTGSVAGESISGSVSCTVSSSTGSASISSTIAATASPAEVVLTPLPGVPTVSGSGSSSVSYTVSCSFTSTNPSYSGSQSNTVTGTVTNAAASTRTPTTGLNVQRENQQANLLQDGTILITGGENSNGPISTSEIFGGNSFSLAASMSVARTGHQATLLSNSTGQVLITGGTDNLGDVYSSAELFTRGSVPGAPGAFGPTTLYDPVAGAFTSTVSSMNIARTSHAATELISGRILITGGLDANGEPLSSAELFDPTAGTFTYTSGSMVSARYGHNATLLSDGTVLLSGGTGDNTAEIYNPATDSFAATNGSMKVARTGAQAVLIGGGAVLITGGLDSSGNIESSAELYSPTTGTFATTVDTKTNAPTSMNSPRVAHTTTVLPDGTVLIAGGQGTGGTALSSEEVYDPGTGDFSTVASGMITARSNHTATLMIGGSVLIAGGLNGTPQSASEVYWPSLTSGALYPKFMVLDVLYAPPGAGSTMTYTDATMIGTSTSTDNTFKNEHTIAVKASIPVPYINAVLTPEFDWGHTTTQDGTSTFTFNTTTTNSVIVPGAAAAGTEGTKKVISSGVDHESDIIRIWLNPAAVYTLPPTASSTLIWNGFATNPNDPNVVAGAMDIVALTVSQLDGSACNFSSIPCIPAELQAALDRNWDSAGAGGLQTADFQTILQRDPFATNTSLNGSPVVPLPHTAGTFFDPDIPVPDPVTQQCSTRYNFDPVLGQTFAFGQLGSANQALTQNYSLQSTTSHVTGNTTTDMYSVANTLSVTLGLPGKISVSFENANTFTWTNTYSNTKTNSSTTTQALSIKNPLVTDNYSGPTQMQVWQDKIYGTFMFYPHATDTSVSLISSQSTAGPGESVMLIATVIADPKLAASSNPPLVPSGTVTFYDACTVLGSAQVNSSTGIASITVSSLATGSHSILASYSGDSNFLHNISEAFTENVVGSSATVPYISGLSQAAGPTGSTVIISGVNFGSSGTVTFNGVTASTTQWTPSSISAVVPASATSGVVVVTTNGNASNGVYFEVTQPSGKTSTTVILSPASAISGYPVTLNVSVTGTAGTIPSGTVSCSVQASGSSGVATSASNPDATLDATGSAQLIIPRDLPNPSDLPTVAPNGATVPYSVTCNFNGSTGFASSQSSPVTGSISAVPSGIDAAVGSLNVPRENQQTNLLADGTILVTGGDNGSWPLSSAELYSNAVFSLLANSMTTPRTDHQQTVLNSPTGQVLITGGSDGNSALASAELYTPGTPGMPGTFEPTTLFNTEAQVFTQTVTMMTTARTLHTATLLTTSQVLIAGGSDQNGNALSTAEIFNPSTGLFTATKQPMIYARIGHQATLLLDGTVLITGGVDQNDNPVTAAEIYNPITNVFTQTAGSMLVGRVNCQATRLGSGMVLITGGRSVVGVAFSSAELYNPATGTFQYTKNSAQAQTYMTAARFNHTASLLADGTVLIAGGESAATNTLATMEIYDPVVGGFSAAASGLQVPHHNHTATVLPIAGVLIAGGTNTTASVTTVEANAEVYTPYTILTGLHPKYMVVNVQYAPPGAGSTMTYSNQTTVGTSTGTENSFTHSESLTTSVGINLGIFKLTDSVDQTWTNTQDSSSSFSLNNVTADSEVVPGPCNVTPGTQTCAPNGATDQSLGVEHESDVVWVWLNPVSDYIITSPSTFVWGGYASDPSDPNSPDGGMDVIPLSVSQLDGTSTITQAEWDVLDRSWDPISSGGAGPITQPDLLTILARDPFATNLSGVGRATAPTIAPTGSQYTTFDPNIPTYDPATGQCGNRYDFTPAYDMTFPFSPLGSTNQAITQDYKLATTTAQSSSSSTTDTYQVAISANLNFKQNPGTNLGPLGDLLCATVGTGDTPWGGACNAISWKTPTTTKGTVPGQENSITESLKFKGYVQWTNKWNSSKNNSVLQTEDLSIKNPLYTDNYTGPEQIQVWTDNLYGTFMFYPKPSDTNWVLTSAQTTVNSGSTVALTAYVIADPHVPAMPTGTVTFYDGCTVLGTGSVNAATGTVSITATLTAPTGSHMIQAIYGGDMNFFHNNSNPVVVTVQ